MLGVNFAGGNGAAVSDTERFSLLAMGELAAYPPDDISIDPLQGRTQLRLIEVAVVSDPAADARVVHLGQFGQGLVAAMMKRPAADISADARQCLRADGGLETVREDAPGPATETSSPRAERR